MKILILEDHEGRIAEFRKALASIPGYEVEFWRDAPTMIAEMKDHLGNARLISLDHDLVGGPCGPDPGDGLQVAEALAAFAPTCPVILHSTNRERVQSMTRELNDHGWKTSRVAPLEMGEEWIHTQWIHVARHLLMPTGGGPAVAAGNAIVEFAAQMLRYTVGIVAAYVVSGLLIVMGGLVIFGAGGVVGPEGGLLLGAVWIGVIGYSAVTAATLCTDVTSRHISSWFFTFLGAALFFYHWHDLSGLPRVLKMESPLGIISWMSAGGIIASLRFTFKMRSEPPTEMGSTDQVRDGTKKRGAIETRLDT